MQRLFYRGLGRLRLHQRSQRPRLVPPVVATITARIESEPRARLERSGIASFVAVVALDLGALNILSAFAPKLLSSPLEFVPYLGSILGMVLTLLIAFNIGPTDELHVFMSCCCLLRLNQRKRAAVKSRSCINIRSF